MVAIIFVNLHFIEVMRKVFVVILLLVAFCPAEMLAQKQSKTKQELKAEAKEKANAKKAKEDAKKAAEVAKKKSAADKKAKASRKTVKRKKLPKFPGKEFNYGIAAATDGLAAGIHRMERSNEDDMAPAYGFFLEVAEQKDPRELRRASAAKSPVNGVTPNRYVYGKIYNNYQLKVGYLRRIPITGKLDVQNVRVNYFWASGLNLGLFKPYMLNLDRNGATTVEQYTVDNSSIFLDRDYIVGSAGFTQGLNLITYQFGLLGRTGLQFEYLPSRYRGLIGELGAEFKVSLGNGLTTMANAKSRLVYPSVYLAFRLASLKD
jgi:Ni/Co efflux regulator RcnB